MFLRTSFVIREVTFERLLFISKFWWNDSIKIDSITVVDTIIVVSSWNSYFSEAMEVSSFIVRSRRRVESVLETNEEEDKDDASSVECSLSHSTIIRSYLLFILSLSDSIDKSYMWLLFMPSSFLEFRKLDL